MGWKQLLAHLPRFNVRRRRQPQVISLSAELREDVYGLPGDLPCDFPKVLSTITSVMDKVGVRWCIVGDILLAHYLVPKVIGDIEICLLSDDLRRVEEAFLAEAEFCFPYRPARSTYTQHLAQHPRFKVKGMRQCIFLVPHDHYGLDPLAFDDIWVSQDENIPIPLLPLPHYVRGLASLAVRPDTENVSFCVQIEFLIDGMDIDEEWCRMYLDGSSRDFVIERSSPLGRKSRMGSHPKYDGNITSYIHDEAERNRAAIVKGRVLDDHGRRSNMLLSMA